MLFSKPFDIIHCHDLWVLPAAAILKKIHNGRLVYDAHEYYAGLEIFLHTQMRKKLWLFLEHRCMAHIDRLITVSQALGDQYRKHYVNLRQVNIILNVPKFESIPHTVLKQTLKDAREILVVFHGHFKPGRGLENLIQAVKIVSGVKLLLIGGGEIENRLRKIVQDEGLNYRVSFQNYIPTSELISTSAQADIGAVLFEPSSINYKFALPNKFFEYIMAGLPILASDIVTLRYYIMKYDIGVTVNPCDIEAIANSITKMKSDKQQFQKWKMNTLRAAKDLNWENEESKLIDIYQRISD
jgi:glycosyltransferase involved in cell wall biosynthesis